MPLITCPDCEKQISDRVDACPFCGCPKQYFDLPSTASTQSTKSTPVVPTVEDIELMPFHVAGYEIQLPAGKYKAFAQVFGQFYKLEQFVVDGLRESYDSSKNIKKALESVYENAKFAIDNVIDEAIKILYGQNVILTREQFIGKYNKSLDIDYTPYYNAVNELYLQANEWKSNADRQRAFEKASRGRWAGGGFGIKGALKGAVEASLLNAGSDFLHSFGDNAKANRDEKDYQKVLLDLYKDPELKSLLCDTVAVCIGNIYLAVIYELIENGVLDEKYFHFDPDKANTIYEHTCKYETDKEKVVTNMLDCILYNPVDLRFYDIIKGEIYANIEMDDENNFYAFAEYWGIEDRFEKIRNIPRTGWQKQFASRITKALKSVGYKEDEDSVWCIDLMLDDEDELKSVLRESMGIPNIGHQIFIADSSIILTDAYIWVEGNKTLALEPLKDYKWDMVSYNNISYLVVLGEKEVIEVLSFYTFVPDFIKDVLCILNVGFGIKGAEESWKQRALDYEFDNYVKDIKIKEIKSVEDYIFYQQFIWDFKVKSGYSGERGKKVNEIYALYDKMAKNYNYQYDFIQNIKLADWMPQEVTREQFFQAVLEDSEYFKGYWNQLWVKPNGINAPFYPEDSTLVRLKPYGELYLYKDFSLLQTGKNGIALTKDKLISLKDIVIFDIATIKMIAVDAKSILIADNNKSVNIKVSGWANDEDTCNWDDESRLVYIINVLKVYCVRFGNNTFLWNNNMLTANPDKNNRDKQNITVKTQKIIQKEMLDFDDFMEKCGYKYKDFEDKKDNDVFVKRLMTDVLAYYQKYDCNDLYEDFTSDNHNHYKNELHYFVCRMDCKPFQTLDLYKWVQLDCNIKNYCDFMLNYFRCLFGCRFGSNNISNLSAYTQNVCTSLMKDDEEIILHWIDTEVHWFSSLVITSEGIIDIDDKVKYNFNDIIEIYTSNPIKLTIGDKEKVIKYLSDDTFYSNQLWALTSMLYTIIKKYSNNSNIKLKPVREKQADADFDSFMKTCGYKKNDFNNTDKDFVLKVIKDLAVFVESCDGEVSWHTGKLYSSTDQKYISDWIKNLNDEIYFDDNIYNFISINYDVNFYVKIMHTILELLKGYIWISNRKEDGYILENIHRTTFKTTGFGMTENYIINLENDKKYMFSDIKNIYVKNKNGGVIVVQTNFANVELKIINMYPNVKYKSADYVRTYIYVELMREVLRRCTINNTVTSDFGSQQISQKVVINSAPQNQTVTISTETNVKTNNIIDIKLFITTFLENIRNTEEKAYIINQPLESITNGELAEKLSYQRKNFPDQHILYFDGKVYFSDKYFGWVSLFKPISELKEIIYDNTTVLILLHNGEKYRLDSAGHKQDFVDAINYALDLKILPNKEPNIEVKQEEIVTEVKPVEVITEVKREEIKVCPSCRKTIKANVKFCNFCGKNIEQESSIKTTQNEKKLCPSCGKEIKIDTKFCNFCGNLVDTKNYTKCFNCGKIIGRDIKFCNFCGKNNN